MDQPVLFYGARNPWGEFSNFFPSPFVLEGREWPTVEHYYVAMKSTDPTFHVRIQRVASPARVKRLGRSVALRANWDRLKVVFMERAVLAKFEQNVHLRAVLLGTGARPLHENSRDPWWGGGPNFPHGRDLLGQVLMRVRSVLQENQVSYTESTLAAIAGQACGDAYGAPFEFQPNAREMAELSLAEQRYVCSREDVGQPNPAYWRKPGVYTDDTQQALLLMFLRSEFPTAPGSFIRGKFMEWCRILQQEEIPYNSFGVHRGTGGNFRKAVMTGRAVPTAGLGAPMRVGPVATMLEDPAEILPWIHQVSRGTTSSPLSLAGTILFAMVCWKESHPDASVTPADWGEIPPPLAEAWNLSLEAFRVLKKGEDRLVRWAMRNGSNKQLRCAADGFALTGVPWAIQCGHQAASYEDALFSAAASGGDTDTVCAMAGCIAAIRLGKQCIPEWMTQGLLGWDHIHDPHKWDPLGSEIPLTEADSLFRQKFSGFGAFRTPPP